MTLRLAAALIACAALYPGPAPAGDLGAGTLDVRLPPGAVARLRALGFSWSAEVAERDGAAVFLAVPPGRHELTVERSGMSTARTLLVQPGTTVVVTAGVDGGASGIEETTADQPAEGTAFREEWLRDLPSSRDPWSLLETTETVAIADRMDTGGVFAGAPGRATAHGTSLTQAGFRFGGAEVVDPLGTGASLFDPDLAWVSSLRFATALLPASVAGGGPVLEAIPLRPGDTWVGRFTGDVARPDSIGDVTAAPPIARLDHWRSGALVAAGPLTDRVGLLLAVSRREAGRFEREEPLQLTSRVHSLMGQLVFTPREGQQARLLGVGQAVKRPFAGRAGALAADSRESAGFGLVQGDWTGRRGDGATATLRLAHARGTLDSAGVRPGGLVERLRDGPIPEIPLPGDRVRARTSAEGQIEWPNRRLLGGHATFLVGASLARERATTTFPSGRWFFGELLDGLRARAWAYRPGSEEAQWNATDAAAWAEARTDPVRRLSLQAGARLEWLDASAAAASEDVSWLALSPRLRARFRLGPKLALVGGYGRYRHRLPLSALAFGDPGSPVGEVYRWGENDIEYPPTTPGVRPVARVGPGAAVASLDPGLRAPRTDEVLLGLERRSGTWTARFVGLYRRETHLLETVNLGVTAADYTMRTVPDPGGDILGPGDDQLLPVFERRASSFGADRYLLTNVTGDDAWHEGAEITVAREGDRFGLLFGATAHRSDGPNAWRGFRPAENDQGFIGERRDQPNADTFARGRLFSDRAYSIKVASRYAAPGDVRLGVVARYQDGQPFARLVIVPGLAQGTEVVQAVPNGRHRFEFAITVDARVEKGFTLGRARVAAVAEGFNLFNNAHEVEEYVVTGPAFRTPTASQPPRVFRVGLRLDVR